MNKTAQVLKKVLEDDFLSLIETVKTVIKNGIPLEHENDIEFKLYRNENRLDINFIAEIVIKRYKVFYVYLENNNFIIKFNNEVVNSRLKKAQSAIYYNLLAELEKLVSTWDSE